MSADNAIIILGTNSVYPKDELEFRVAHCQAPENIYVQQFYVDANTHSIVPPQQYKPTPDVSWIHHVFQDSPVFSSFVDALDYAKKLETDIGYVEYGIITEIFADLIFPLDLPDETPYDDFPPDPVDGFM